MPWIEAIPAVAFTALLLFIPGGLVALAAGLRAGAVLLGVSPLLSVGLVAVSAVLAPLLGLEWSLVPVIGLTIVAALVMAALSALFRRGGWPGPHRDDRQTSLAAVVAVLLGLAIAALGLLPGLGGADAVSQTFDASFHYNAVRLAVDGGNASSLYLGVLANPGQTAGFYPAAWHGLVSLVVLAAEPNLIVAANAVSIGLAGLAWPATTVLLVRQLAGTRWSVLLVAGALSGAFAALPVRILAFGVLFPNTTGYVLVPAALAAVVGAVGLARDDAFGRPRAIILILAAIPALGLAHPNALFTLVLLALPALLFAAVKYSWAAGRAGQPLRAALPWLAGAGVIAAVTITLRVSSVFSYVSTFDWPESMTIAQAAGEVLLLATSGARASWLLAFVVLAGLATALLRPRLRWLAVSYVAAAALYMLAAGADSQISAALTGPWYNDAFRLAAILPIIGVPLAALGISAAVDWVVHRSSAVVETSDAESRWIRRKPHLAVVAAAIVLVLTGFGYAAERTAILRESYTLGSKQGTSPLLTTDEYSLMQDLPGMVPSGVAVAGNPWNGSALVWAVADRPVPFPHVDGSWDEARRLVATRLRDVAWDREVCGAVRQLNVGYAIESGPFLWRDRRAAQYPGLEDLDEVRGFELVDERGDTRLYRIVECAETVIAG